MPNFFSPFPKDLIYPLGGDRRAILTDIFRRSHPRDTIINSNILESYRVQDGESPDEVSYRLYGTVDFYWILLLVNNITNTYTQWPMSSDVLYKYAVEKYGATNLNDVHHYIDENSYIVDYDYANVGQNQVAITNWDYESEVNSEKSQILVLKTEAIPEFVSSFQSSLAR